MCVGLRLVGTYVSKSSGLQFGRDCGRRETLFNASRWHFFLRRCNANDRLSGLCTATGIMRLTFHSTWYQVPGTSTGTCTVRRARTVQYMYHTRNILIGGTLYTIPLSTVKSTGV